MRHFFNRLKSYYFNHSIRTNLFLFFLLLFILITLPSTIMLSYYQNVQNQKQVTEMLNNNLNTSAVNLDQTIQNARRISTSIMSSDITQKFLNSVNHESTDIHTLENAMYVICSSSASKLSSYIFDMNGSCYYSDSTRKKSALSSIEDLPQFKKIKSLDGKILCIDTSDLFRNASGISLVRVINDINTMNDLGYLVINIPSAGLEKAFPPSKSSTYQGFILGEHGRNLLATQMTVDLLNKINNSSSGLTNLSYTLNNVNYTVGYQPLTEYNNYIIGFIYHDDKEITQKNFMFNGRIIVVAINVVILWVGIFLISRSVTKPIISLAETMSKFSNKEFQKITTRYGFHNELGHLVACHNNMVTEIQLLLDKEILIEKHRRHLELNLLQTQFKPHFLYNTIDHARVLCLSGETQKTNLLLLSMGNYYKTILSKGKNLIPIQDEIDTIRQFHTILSMDEDSTYTIQYDIDERVLTMYILKFVLQPLVENCIKHGLLGVDDGKITIHFSLTDPDTLTFSVSDNGVGMTKQLVNEIMEQSYHSSSKSFGLAATLERMRLLYGNDCMIQIDNSKEGTTISFRINNYSYYSAENE